RHERGHEQQQVGEVVDQEAHHGAEGVEQPGEVRLQPVDGAVGPFADRHAGHEGIVLRGHRSPPGASEGRRGGESGSPTGPGPGPGPAPGSGPSAGASEPFSPRPTPAAVRSVTRGTTPAKRPSSSTTTSGLRCCAESVKSSATGVSCETTGISWT